jgi:hypothetical protein
VNRWVTPRFVARSRSSKPTTASVVVRTLALEAATTASVAVMPLPAVEVKTGIREAQLELAGPSGTLLLPLRLLPAADGKILSSTRHKTTTALLRGDISCEWLLSLLTTATTDCKIESTSARIWGSKRNTNNDGETRLFYSDRSSPALRRARRLDLSKKWSMKARAKDTMQYNAVILSRPLYSFFSVEVVSPL